MSQSLAGLSDGRESQPNLLSAFPLMPRRFVAQRRAEPQPVHDAANGPLRRPATTPFPEARYHHGHVVGRVTLLGPIDKPEASHATGLLEAVLNSLTASAPVSEREGRPPRRARPPVQPRGDAAERSPQCFAYDRPRAWPSASFAASP